MKIQRRRSFAGDVGINMIFTILMIAITVVTVPLYIGQIGLERYGILTLVWTLTGMLSVFDLGMGAATTHFVARARSGLPGPAIGNVIMTTGLVNLTIGSVLGLLFWIAIGPLVFGRVDVGEGLGGEIAGMLDWIALLIPVSLLSAIFRSTLDGQRRFITGNVIGSGGNIATVIGALMTAYWVGPALPNLVLSVLTVRSVVLVAYFLACLSALRSGHLMTGKEFRETLRFGGWDLLFSSVSGVLGSADRFVIGWIAGASATALYAIPMSFTARLRFLPEAVLRTLFPRLSETAGIEEHRRLGQRALTGVIVAMATIIIPAILFVRPFFGIWLGPEFSASSGAIAQILLVTVFLQSCLRVLFVIERAAGRPKLPARVRTVTAVPMIATVTLFVWLMGAPGAALALAVTFACELLWMLKITGLLGSSIGKIIGYLALCGACIAISQIGYGLIAGAVLATTAMVCLAILAVRQSEDLARLLQPIVPSPLWKAMFSR